MSSLFKINGRDFAKGLVVAVIVAILQVVLDLMQQKGLDMSLVDWKGVADIALKAASAYILKNLISDDQGRVLGKI